MITLIQLQAPKVSSEYYASWNVISYNLRAIYMPKVVGMNGADSLNKLN